MKYEKFTKGNLKDFRGILEKRFNEIENETGVKLSIGNISFQEGSFTTKLEAKIAGKIGDDEIKKFALYAELYGMDPSDYGKTFVKNGKTYRIIRINPKSPKNAIEIECEGKEYRASPEMVKAMLLLEKQKSGVR